ncbi:unnamed protein product [Mytilus edulis]|uniref:Integrase catalytic domain-containing protein n=1 Tax=Mytilus edulis TaxID=6550 RepID=A0A8S3V407_MYTED|nr:unnamed protein product [Mytilus edulis]
MVYFGIFLFFNYPFEETETNGEDVFPNEGEVVNRTAYASHYSGGCETQAYDIKIKGCTGFLVYYLVPTKTCNSAYCFGEEEPCPLGNSSETGFTPGCGHWRLDPIRYSSFVKRLVRVQVYVHRFIDNCRLKQEQRRQGSLSTVEYADAELEIIKNAQREAFSDEYNALMKSKDLPKTSKLLGLQPRIDENGLIRCDGRLEYADFLSFDARYPIILPRKNWVTKLIVKRYHELGKHVSGTNQTFSALSSRFWIISGREEIREYEHECYTCRKKKAKVAEQVMAPLPEIRFKTPLHAFARTAVDFGGPFITVQGRGKRRQKRYLCLFTCLASRAVHLEVAFGLDTDSFLNAFYRMVNRRGLPKEMISDNGTNFVGANRELKELVALLDKDKIHNSISNQGIKWHFNPPLAPHFGGIHETMIKSAKRAIYAILGNADINDEELLTAFTGAEALINSRPLTYQSADPKDDTPLTPNHFLHGQLGGHFAPETVDNTDFNPRKRWRRIQELIRHFWKRWIREWLPGLNKRDKWTKTKRDMKTDDIVLVMNPNVPRGHWPLGRIIEVFPGKDGHVRVAKVSLGQTVLIRPITKLCPLDIETSENDNDLHPDYEYDVRWYINDLEIIEARTIDLTKTHVDDGLGKMVESDWTSSFRPNFIVNCSIQVKGDGYGLPSPEHQSEQFFAGIEIQQDTYIVNENEEIVIPVRLTIPLACNWRKHA